MGFESAVLRRQRQSGPAFNAKRRAYRADNRAALKLTRCLGISMNEARQLAQSHTGVKNVTSGLSPPRE